MSKIVWDAAGERLYETGVSKGVLYPMVEGQYTTGVAWNGLTSVNENKSGGESTPIYADNIVYLNLTSVEKFEPEITAYTYPEEFGPCCGEYDEFPGIRVTQQRRTPFGLCYQTIIGNDEDEDTHGYKIHIVYGLKAAPASSTYSTVNDSPEAIEFSWSTTSTPVEVGTLTSGHEYKPISHLIIDSTKANAATLNDLKDILYGTDGEGQTPGTDPRLPLPDEIIDMFDPGE